MSERPDLAGLSALQAKIAQLKPAAKPRVVGALPAAFQPKPAADLPDVSLTAGVSARASLLALLRLYHWRSGFTLSHNTMRDATAKLMSEYSREEIAALEQELLALAPMDPWLSERLGWAIPLVPGINRSMLRAVYRSLGYELQSLASACRLPPPALCIAYQLVLLEEPNHGTD